jgi:hypothetical protein
MFREAATVVCNADVDAPVDCAAGNYDASLPGVDAAQRVASIVDQVEHHLLQLHAFRKDRRDVVRRPHDNFDAPRYEITAHECEHVVDDRANRDWQEMLFPRAKQIPEITYDRARPPAFGFDVGKNCAYLIVLDIRLAQIFLGRLCVRQDRAERLPELVGEGARERAGRSRAPEMRKLHALLLELDLDVRALVLIAFAIRNVDGRADETDGAIVTIALDLTAG